MCYVTLAMLYLKQQEASGTGDMNAAVSAYRSCEEYLNRADAIKQNYYLTMCGKGVYLGLAVAH